MSLDRDALAGMSPAELADLAAQAVRALNHATLGLRLMAGGYEDPADVAAVVAGLTLLATRLPQSLRQARAWLEARDAAGRLSTDDRVEGDHARAVIEETFGDLERAEGAADDLRINLTYASRWTACLRTDSDPAPAEPDGLTGAVAPLGVVQ